MATETELERHSQRMRQLLDFLGMNQAQFARSIGKNSQEPIRRVLTKLLRISPALAETIVEKYPQISYYWLVKGVGSIEASDQEIRTRTSRNTCDRCREKDAIIARYEQIIEQQGKLIDFLQKQLNS